MFHFVAFAWLSWVVIILLELILIKTSFRYAICVTWWHILIMWVLSWNIGLPRIWILDSLHQVNTGCITIVWLLSRVYVVIILHIDIVIHIIHMLLLIHNFTTLISILPSLIIFSLWSTILLIWDVRKASLLGIGYLSRLCHTRGVLIVTSSWLYRVFAVILM